MTSVAVSVLCHNRLDLTKKCLASVLGSVGPEVAVLVTDNASIDGTQEWLEALAAGDRRVRIRRNPSNLGFGGPHNEALAAMPGVEFFVVLNNDCVVPPGWMEAMLAEFARDPLVALVGVRGGCTELGLDGCGRPGPGVEYIEASCMMARADLIRAHGLFSPEYKVIYCEDSDLSLRMRSLGYRLAIARVDVPHARSSTVDSSRSEVDFDGFQNRNRKVLLEKWRAYFLTRRFPSERPRNGTVLVRRRGALGDVILTTPAIAAFKVAYPSAMISVLTDHPEVFEGNQDILSASRSKLQGPFDTVYDLDMAYESVPLRHVVHAYGERMGVPVSDLRPRLFSRADERAAVSGKVPAGAKIAVLHPGKVDHWAGRQWPLANFERVSKSLHAAGFFVAMVGNGQTPALTCDLDARGWPFQRTVALVERANLFIGVDSSPFHVAQAFRVPAVAVFGSIEPALRLDPGGRAVGVTAEPQVGCVGCHHLLPAPRMVTSTCEKGAFGPSQEPCMRGVTVERVLMAAEGVLSKADQALLPLFRPEGAIVPSAQPPLPEPQKSPEPAKAPLPVKASVAKPASPGKASFRAHWPEKR